MGVVALVPATDAKGKLSTEPDVWTPDTYVEKPYIFAALKNGSFEGVAYNFNTDIYTLLGRAKTSLSASECTATLSSTSSTTGSVSSTGSQQTSGSTSGTGSSTGVQNDQDSGASAILSSFALIAISIFLSL